MIAATVETAAHAAAAATVRAAKLQAAANKPSAQRKNWRARFERSGLFYFTRATLGCGMGLRLVAHYYDRSEAYVARSLLEGTGMLVLLHNEEWIRTLPHLVGALGGYRLMVSEIDLEDAVAMLTEAKLNPLLEGERLEVRGGIWDRIVSFLLGYAIGGVPVSIRETRWVSFD
jgi:hypothetical protein